mgnify:CR=1 FL=1
MQGLMLKDLFNLKKNIGPTLVTTICVGLLLMIQGNPSMFVVGITLAGGSICSSCLKMDETVQWGKFELTAPVSRLTVVIEKYILLFVFTLISLVIGGAISYIAGNIAGTFDISNFLVYAAVGFSLGIISGSLIIFCLFRFGLIRADFFTTICYLIPVGIFVGVLVVLEKAGYDIMAGLPYLYVTCIFPIIALIISVLMAILSIIVYRKKQF